LGTKEVDARSGAFTSFGTKEVDAERREDGFAVQVESHPLLALRARSLRAALLRKGKGKRGSWW
jgi:hypothetical protein